MNHDIFQEPWFDFKRVTGTDGSCVDVPLGDYCWACAVSLECWPLDNKEASLEKYKAQELFRQTVQNIREGVVAAKQQIMLEKVSTFKNTEVSCRMIRRYNFVYSTTFAKYFGVPLDLVSDMAVTMLTVDYDYADGMLIRGALPADLEHDEVEITTGSSRIRQEELIGPSTAFRPGQAGERFQRSANAHIQGRPAGTKPNSRRPMTFEQIKVKVVEEDKRRQELEAEMAASNTVRGAQSEHVSGSRMALDDQEEMMAATLLKKGPKATVSRRVSAAAPCQGAAAGAAKLNLETKASPATPGPRSLPSVPSTPAGRGGGGFSRRWAPLSVGNIPVLGTAGAPPCTLAFVPGSCPVPGTLAFSVVSGTEVGQGAAAGIEFSIDAVDGDATPARQQTIHDMMSLPKILLNEENVDRRNLRKAWLGKSVCP